MSTADLAQWLRPTFRVLTARAPLPTAHGCASTPPLPPSSSIRHLQLWSEAVWVRRTGAAEEGHGAREVTATGVDG